MRPSTSSSRKSLWAFRRARRRVRCLLCSTRRERSRDQCNGKRDLGDHRVSRLEINSFARRARSEWIDPRSASKAQGSARSLRKLM